jgi:spore coat protein A
MITRSRRSRPDTLRRPRPVLTLEALERRVLMAAPVPVLQPPVPLLNPATVPQFVNDITGLNPLLFKYDADTANHYTVTTQPIQVDVGLGQIDPATGQPYLTNMFGYVDANPNATIPSLAPYGVYYGKTFEVQENQPIAVTWNNDLPDQHVVPIDPTLLDGAMAGYPDPFSTYDPVTNSIPGGIPAVPHLHGGHTDAVYDGTPMQWWNRLDPGTASVGMEYHDTTVFNPTQPANTFTYRNDQQAATLWYHDHAMGVTRLNAYAGMAGFYIIRNQYDTGLPNNPLGLPAGPYEIGLAIQDKQFLANGQLWFPADAQTWNGTPNVASTGPEMFGDVIMVNGQAWPKMNVEARRYRLRLLNGSDSRFYTMTFGDPAVGTTPIWQIGTDDGLLNSPVKLNQLVLGPGERADVIVDFSKFKPGTRFVLTNTAATPFPNGARVVAGLTDRIMAFDVVAPAGPDNTVVPTKTGPTTTPKLNFTNPIPAPTVVTPTRDVALYETTDKYGRITPLMGTPASSAEFLDPITENPALGTTEVWQIYNNTPDAHPIHLHQVAYQVLTRNTFTSKLTNLGVDPETGVTHWKMGPVTSKTAPVVVAGNEVAWKDTIQIFPGEVITVRATFDLPGKYVTHCHILSHEEHDMMRFMQVGDVEYPTPTVNVPAATAVLAEAGGTVFSNEAVAAATQEEEIVSVVDQVLT